MEKATIAEWKFNEGDSVSEGDIVLVIDTEKVAHEVEATISGKIAIIGVVGDDYPCGETVALIAETEDEYSQIVKDKDAFKGQAEEESRDEPEQEASAKTVKKEPAGKTGKILISPVARKLAEKNDIDISKVEGTGPRGRIQKQDVELAIQNKSIQPESVESEQSAKVASGADIYEGKRVKETIAVTGMRKVISDHLFKSLSESAQLTAMGEVDMTEMIALRNKLVTQADQIGVKITYTDIFIMLAAKALKHSPIVNSTLMGNEIKVWDDINIGFAVSIMLSDGQSGLVVPVIKNADQKSLLEIARLRKELVDKARSGQLSLDEMTGGTFTITNTGTFSGHWHIQTPIISPGQSAILGTSSIVRKPVVEGDEIIIKPMMPVSFTFDHRVMDGFPPAQFLGKMGEMILDATNIMLN